MNHTKPRYSINDLLELLSIGRGTLYAEIKLGRLKTYTLGKRRFADPEAVDEYVANCKNQTEAVWVLNDVFPPV